MLTREVAARPDDLAMVVGPDRKRHFYRLKPAGSIPPVQSESGLPAKCPYCGATVDPRDIEWLEDRIAMCEYCGSMLEA